MKYSKHYKFIGLEKEMTDSLFNWRAPNLPNDFCFLKRNNEWLVNTSHECICDIITGNLI